MLKKAFFFLMFILCSCSVRKYQQSDYQKSEFSEKRKSVVVLRAKGKTSFIGTAPKVSFDLVKINPNDLFHEGSVNYRISPGFFGIYNPWDKTYTCLMVEPGIYTIDNISWEQGNVTYYTGKESIALSSLNKWGGFIVKPGTVNYVGELEFECLRNGVCKITHKNSIEEAREQIRKKYPELSEKLQETRFYIPGEQIEVFQAK